MAGKRGNIGTPGSGIPMLVYNIPLLLPKINNQKPNDLSTVIDIIEKARWEQHESDIYIPNFTTLVSPSVISHLASRYFQPREAHVSTIPLLLDYFRSQRKNSGNQTAYIITHNAFINDDDNTNAKLPLQQKLNPKEINEKKNPIAMPKQNAPLVFESS